MESIPGFSEKKIRNFLVILQKIYKIHRIYRFYRIYKIYRRSIEFPQNPARPKPIFLRNAPQILQNFIDFLQIFHIIINGWIYRWFYRMLFCLGWIQISCPEIFDFDSTVQAVSTGPRFVTQSFRISLRRRTHDWKQCAKSVVLYEQQQGSP